MKKRKFLLILAIIFSIFFIPTVTVEAAEYRCHVCGTGENQKYLWNNYDVQQDESCNYISELTTEEECLVKNDKSYSCFICGAMSYGTYQWIRKSDATKNCALQKSIIDQDTCLKKDTNVEKCFECAGANGQSYIWSNVEPSDGYSDCKVNPTYTSESVCKANNTIMSGEFGNILREAFNIIRIVGIGMVLVLSSLDFFKGMLEGDQDTIKKASNTAFKRFVYAVIIFFLPAIVDLLVSLIDGLGKSGF